MESASEWPIVITSNFDAVQDAAWHVPIEQSKENGLSKKSSADTFQVRSISEARLVRKIGVISNEVMARINKALKISLDL